MVHFRQKVATAHQTSICNATNAGRRKIRDILQQQDPLFQVPIFQRRYCWDEDQWDTLLSDALAGKPHSLGRLTCTNVANAVEANVGLDVAVDPSTPDSALDKADSSEVNDSNESEQNRAPQRRRTKHRSVILDGQQRFTTITLLLASLRDTLSLLLLEVKEEASSNPSLSMIQTINKFLFADMDELSSWLQKEREPTTNHQQSLLCEGVELSFAKLIPTFCDRWSYYTAILPKGCSSGASPNDLETVAGGPTSTKTSSWHRPLQAKQHFDSRLGGYKKEQLIDLANSILDNFHMLYFPIDIIGRDDGTEDLMVVYERLALRDATFCKPSRDDEFVSMDGIDMIRNLLLGSFRNESDTIQFYKTIWLPIERLADNNNHNVVTSTSSQEKDESIFLHSNVESGTTSCRTVSASNTGRNTHCTMRGMIQSFLLKQDDFVEQDAGTIGGRDYANFQFWLENQMKKQEDFFGESKKSSNYETAHMVVFQIGETMLEFAKAYFEC